MTTNFQHHAAQHSPLHDKHVALGAQFTNFGGFEMPVRYESDLKEHQAVRNGAGLFDVSHMGKLFISGEGAASLLDFALAGDMSGQEVGSAKYTLMLNDSGGIIDDLLSYRLSEQHFMLVPNAGNQLAVFDALQEYAEQSEVFTGTVMNGAAGWGILALQGPMAERVLRSTPGLVLPDELPKYYRFVETTHASAKLFLARTGYTGEDGFELVIDIAGLAGLWDALMEAGASLAEAHTVLSAADQSVVDQDAVGQGFVGLLPAGLAARDSLRLEAGFPLYGNELGPDVRPTEVGLGRIVSMSKAEFVGKRALEENPGNRTLVALQGDGRRAARSGYPVLSEGEIIGSITSGALSPTLGFPIAFALVDSGSCVIGDTVQVDLRGKPQDYLVVKSPFYRQNSKSTQQS